MAEISGRLTMEFLAEALAVVLQLLAEALLQFILEALVEVGARKAGSKGHDDHAAPGPLHPALSCLGYAALGAASGALSLYFLPTSLVQTGWQRMLNLVVAPALAGLAMNALGNWRLRHHQAIISLDRFGYAYCFALALALVRFVWAR